MRTHCTSSGGLKNLTDFLHDLGFKAGVSWPNADRLIELRLLSPNRSTSVPSDPKPYSTNLVLVRQEDQGLTTVSLTPTLLALH